MISNVRQFLAAVPAVSIALLSHVGVCPACWPLIGGLMSSLGLTFLVESRCSVQGQLAAQIALRDGEGNPCTLYVVPLTDTLARVRPGVVTADRTSFPKQSKRCS